MNYASQELHDELFGSNLRDVILSLDNEDELPGNTEDIFDWSVSSTRGVDSVPIDFRIHNNSSNDCSSLVSDISIELEHQVDDSFHHDIEDCISSSCDMSTESVGSQLISLGQQEGRRAKVNSFCQLNSCKPFIVKRKNSSLSSECISCFEKIPDELLALIGSFLDIASLNAARSTCQQFHRALSRNDAGWERHCCSLWGKKVAVCKDAKSMLMPQQQQPINSSQDNCTIQCPNQYEYPYMYAAMKAYQLSCYDGGFRQEISVDELCFDPIRNSGPVWYFRFKDTAGSDWTALDPWHTGSDARRMVFLADGTVKEIISMTNNLGEDEHIQSSVSESDNIHMRTTSNSSLERYNLQPAFFNVLSSQRNQDNNYGDENPVVRLGDMKWRFISNPVGLPLRPCGSYLRLSVGGRDVPTYIVRRSPSGNWGFIMENCWGIFASFPLPQKRRRRRQQRQLFQPHRQLQQLCESLNLQQTTTIPRNTRSQLHSQHLNVAENMQRRAAFQRQTLQNTSTSYQQHQTTNDLSGGTIFARAVARDMRQSQSCSCALLDDFALPVTPTWQWREALLYNLGVDSLPEGESAK